MGGAGDITVAACVVDRCAFKVQNSRYTLYARIKSEQTRETYNSTAHPHFEAWPCYHLALSSCGNGRISNVFSCGDLNGVEASRQ